MILKEDKLFVKQKAEHVLVIPEVSLPPFPITFPYTSNWAIWEPGYPIVSKRDYFLVYEAARILVKKRIIRRVNATDGIHQMRKLIRQTDYFPTTYLYKNSKKYGYLIPKNEFANFYEYMTGGDSFVEHDWEDSLLRGLENDGGFLAYKIREFRYKADNLQKKMELAAETLTLQEKEKMELQVNILKQKAAEYRKRWYKLILLDEKVY